MCQEPTRRPESRRLRHQDSVLSPKRPQTRCSRRITIYCHFAADSGCELSWWYPRFVSTIGRVAAAHRTACSVSPHEHVERNALRSDAARPQAASACRPRCGGETGLCVLPRVTKTTGQSARAPAGATVRARRTQRAHGVKQHPDASTCAARLLTPVASGDAGVDATKLSARRAATVATGRSIALLVAPRAIRTCARHLARGQKCFRAGEIRGRRVHSTADPAVRHMTSGREKCEIWSQRRSYRDLQKKPQVTSLARQQLGTGITIFRCGAAKRAAGLLTTRSCLLSLQ